MILLIVLLTLNILIFAYFLLFVHVFMHNFMYISLFSYTFFFYFSIFFCSYKIVNNFKRIVIFLLKISIFYFSFELHFIFLKKISIYQFFHNNMLLFFFSYTWNLYRNGMFEFYHLKKIQNLTEGREIHLFLNH